MGQDKALMPLAGKAMIAHVLDRFAPQVGSLAINANGPPARFAAFPCPVLPDSDDERPGPLAGIAAGLAFAQARGLHWLASVPCDAPFLPHDLVARLAAVAMPDAPAYAVSAEGDEPLFALWPVAARSGVEAHLRAGRRAVHQVLADLSARPVEIPVEGAIAWNLNLNSPEDLARAAGQMPP